MSQNEQITELISALKSSMLKKIPIDVAFLDFAKAFDKVPHKRLLHKLQAYGIRGKLNDWVKGFLSDRSQRVVLGESSSSWASFTSGVPQGSVLGPILFIIYVNDLAARIKNYCKIYADDCKTIAEIDNSDTKSLQTDLDNVESWSKEWMMQLNYDKCKIIHIGKANPKI